MSQPAIIAENLGKRYILGAFGATSLRDELGHFLKKMTHKGMSNTGPEYRNNKEFWALRDVSFEIEAGDTVGLIGRNGAGKSTLLKILSRITTPTHGGFVMNGKSASLLEVGTGFHPDLTGIENIYLNGAILGMRRWEIKSRLESILEFSGVQQFADTPVKRYSSGMRVRLAFSVAAHLRQDILIVDEVLAVGDHEFQRKCLGKMGEVANEGRTVVFVSHNMFAISRLCRRCMYLKQGKLIEFGDTAEVIDHYMRDSKGNCGRIDWESGFANDEISEFRFDAIEFVDAKGNVGNKFSVVDTISISFRFTVLETIPNFILKTMIRSTDGVTILSSKGGENVGIRNDLKPGCYHYLMKIPEKRLNSGSYSLSVHAASAGQKFLAQLDDVLDLDIALIERQGQSPLVDSPGILYPDVHWEYSTLNLTNR